MATKKAPMPKATIASKPKTTKPKVVKNDTIQKTSEEKISIAKQKRLVATEQILQAIADGLNQTDALTLIGVAYSTWNGWLKADPELAADVKRAELSLKIKHLQNIASHAINDPKCSQWLLSRKFPKEFGDRAIVDMNTTTDDSKIIINVIQQVQKERHSDVIDVAPLEIEQDGYDEED